MLLQRIRSWPWRARVLLVLATGIAGILLLTLAPRVPIGPHYHDFADRRAMFGIPNAFDFLSNIPFVAVGVWALVWLLRSNARGAFLDQRERIPYLVFFAGVALTGFGSGWYHMSPSNARLPWDLLPMTCSFMSIVAATVMERIGVKAGLAALPPLLLLGMASVAYWCFTASHGHDDYKFYLFVQFFAPVLLVELIGLFPPRYAGTRYLMVAFACYVAAKLFEKYDYPIFGFDRVLSGHSLKHITAAISCYWILRMLQTRHGIVPEQTRSAKNVSPDSDLLSCARE